jgi:hypothetical protein
MFKALPNDVLIVIRSYLITFEIVELYADELIQFVRQESERSWRNFLYASNREFWKSIRKETMIWSLNGMAFKKYLRDVDFRRYINERMSVPAQQLLCRTFQARKGFDMNNLMIDAVATSALCCIHIHDFRAHEFPSSERLQFLNLDRCPFLKRLGEYPQLTTLQLRDCPWLKRIRKMERLVELYLWGVNELAVPQFPFEQLSKLHFANYMERNLLDAISHRMKSVKDLRWSCNGIFTVEMFEMCPEVVRLRLCYLSSINLIGLLHLKHLSIYDTPSNQIYGKEEIYSQLKSFAYSSSDRWDSFDYRPELFPNVEEFDLQLPGNGYPRDVSITLSDKIRSFRISLPVSNIISSRSSSSVKPFYQLRLSHCTTIDFLKFANVQILSLQNSPGIEDVSIFQNIPYLTLSDLSSVKDFSSLGKQKYLSLSHCDGLSDEHLSGFGNVFRLSIFGCRGISEVKGLEKNKFLLIHSCYQLTTVILSGKDYVQVSIRECFQLGKLELSGRVYSLEVRACREFYKKRGGLRNCEYWNGKPVHECHWR